MAFVPREQFRQMTAFSRVSGPVDSADGVDPADVRYHAALLQHTTARAVREALARDGKTLGQVLATVSDSEQRGLSKDRIERKLRGEVGMQIADLAFFVQQFPEIAETIAAHILAWAPVEGTSAAS